MLHFHQICRNSPRPVFSSPPSLAAHHVLCAQADWSHNPGLISNLDRGTGFCELQLLKFVHLIGVTKPALAPLIKGCLIINHKNNFSIHHQKSWNNNLHCAWVGFRPISLVAIDSSSCCYHGLATVKPPSEAGTEALALTLTASGDGGWGTGWLWAPEAGEDGGDHWSSDRKLGQMAWPSLRSLNGSSFTAYYTNCADQVRYYGEWRMENMEKKS